MRGKRGCVEIEIGGILYEDGTDNKKKSRMHRNERKGKRE